ncbi:MAG TPA: antitoxin VapB family protein [Candidatus Deferrimicrobium sp.]|nr:antitoxin VapB family protein [Candidatus Deferrimicrobium sp.]
MTSKTISIKEKTYNLLKKMKLPHESFGDTIERLYKSFSTDNLTKWFETTDGWEDMIEAEYDEVSEAIMKLQKNLKPFKDDKK